MVREHIYQKSRIGRSGKKDLPIKYKHKSAGVADGGVCERESSQISVVERESSQISVVNIGSKYRQ